MGEDLIKCPQCAARMPPGTRFCECCGRRMPERDPDPSAVPVCPPVTPAASGAESSVGHLEAPPGGAPFSLQVSLPKAMQVGRRSLVGVRFRAATDLYESVEFALRNGDAEMYRVSCCPGRPQMLEHKVMLEVKPQTAGMMRIDLDVICRIGISGDVEVHTAAIQTDVDAQRPTAFSPVFNISQNQTSDRAGDTRGGNINVNLGGLQMQSVEDTARYETAMSDFRPIATCLRTSPPRLTLKGDGGVLQIVSDRLVSFGRNRGNMIPLRVCGADGRVDKAANEGNISRFHFRVECEGRECLIRDGGEETPSAYGTRVDGEQLSPLGSARLCPGCDVSLGVGRPEVELKMKLRLFCDPYGRPSGMRLDRLDGARQRTCVVWRELPVAEGTKLTWNGSRWTLEPVSSSGAPSVTPCALAVGSSVAIGGKSYEILPFHQTHLD